MSRVSRRIRCLALSLLLASTLSPASVIDLAPIVKEGTPGDLLMEDPVIPMRARDAEQGAPSGTLQKSISDELALPVVGVNIPGNAVQFRGLGRSAEDTDVQALGVPLNPPQGGGFDLAAFPQFIWAGYGFQLGPALGTFDPRGTAGSLTLNPWSACALGACGKGGASRRAQVLGSTAGLAQLSAAASDGQRVAAVAGVSLGDARGPSVALSSRRGPVSFHLLATDIDASTPGPDKLTPLARQRTRRAIPLLQADLGLGAALLKSSAYYDWSSLRYEDPSFSGLPLTQDFIRQLGFENALLAGDWRFGAGGRAVRYRTLGVGELSETVGHVQASRLLEWGKAGSASWIAEPLARGVGVSGYGFRPEASLGLRREEGSVALFARAGMSRHFPSLTNRFYRYPGFPGFPGYQGNPGVRPERDWTASLGAEWKERAFDASVQLYGQVAEDAQVRAPLDASTDTLINQGSARVGSLLVSAAARPTGWVEARASATVSASRVTATGLRFPGLPGLLGVGSVGVGPGIGNGGPGWSARAVVRVSSASVGDSAGGLLPGFTELNLEAGMRWARTWSATARMDNVLDRRIELVKGYPSLGPTLGVLVSAGW